MVIEVSRHGARSPYDQRINLTETHWPEGLGELTKIGWRQHVEIGKKLRGRYIDKLGLLSSAYDEKEILAISSFKDRCYKSA